MTALRKFEHISVTRVKVLEGEGVQGDPCREVSYYFDESGTSLWNDDRYGPAEYGRGSLAIQNGPEVSEIASAPRRAWFNVEAKDGHRVRVTVDDTTLEVAQQAEAALRTKAGATTNPACARRLSKFLRLVDWARSDG